jgi:hypothetical protein
MMGCHNINMLLISHFFVLRINQMFLSSARVLPSASATLYNTTDAGFFPLSQYVLHREDSNGGNHGNQSVTHSHPGCVAKINIYAT